MSIAPPVVSLREMAQRAWAAEQERLEAAIRHERAERVRNYREGLRNAIETSLRIPCILDNVICSLTEYELDNDVRDGAFVSYTRIDGLTLGLMRRGHSLFLALLWQCPTCEYEPVTDTHVRSIEELGALLEHLPTLCPCGQGGPS